MGPLTHLLHPPKICPAVPCHLPCPPSCPAVPCAHPLSPTPPTLLSKTCPPIHQALQEHPRCPTGHSDTMYESHPAQVTQPWLPKAKGPRKFPLTRMLGSREGRGLACIACTPPRSVVRMAQGLEATTSPAPPYITTIPPPGNGSIYGGTFVVGWPLLHGCSRPGVEGE